MKLILLISLVLLSAPAYNQTEPKQRKTKKEKIEERKIDEAYIKLIKQADFEFAQKQYEISKEHYSSALRIKPNEVYPKNQLVAIEDILNAPNSGLIDKQNQEYLKIIDLADRSLAEENYVKARDLYSRALVIRPNEIYATQKLSEVDSIITVTRNIDREYYRKAINCGDSLLRIREYVKAKQAYENASAIKPAEAFPKARLAEIEALIREEENTARAKDLIIQADKLFIENKYNEAKILYLESLVYRKTNEAYGKIQKVDEILSRTDGNEKMLAYDKLIFSADELFKRKEFVKAKELYLKALEINMSAPYPKSKVSEIEQLLKENK